MAPNTRLRRRAHRLARRARNDHVEPQQKSKTLDGLSEGTLIRTTDWQGRAAEVVLIVVSILLAFAIDAAWEGHLERRAEQTVLDAVRSDMKANLESIDYYLGTFESAHVSTVLFMERSPQALRDLPLDSAQNLLFGVLASGAFTGFDGSLMSSNLAMLRDIELRTELGAWLGLYRDVTEDQPFLVGYALRVMELVGPAVSGDPAFMANAEAANLTLQRLRQDQSFLSVLAVFDVVRGVSSNKLRELRASTEEVLARVDQGEK